jgi:hypothetical protein
MVFGRARMRHGKLDVVVGVLREGSRERAEEAMVRQRGVAALQGKWKGRLGLQGSLFMEKDSMGRPSIMGVGYVAAPDACPYRGRR